MHFLSPRAALIAGCLIFAVAFLAPTVTQGDEWNLATRFTVSHPFEVPGIVLQPDTPYVIRLYDSPSTRNIVQIYNGDQTHMLAMFMAISDERLDPADKTVFTFIETEPGFPLPIKEWFYPGRLTGMEFVYPKKQATNIAQHAREPILATNASNLHNLNSQTVEAVGPISAPQPATETAANVTNSQTTSAVEEQPKVVEPPPAEPNIAQEPAVPQVEQPPTELNTEQPAQIAQNTEPAPTVQQEPSTVTPPATEESQELPRTAGELPLIGLIGALCLGAGLGLRVLSAKT